MEQGSQFLDSAKVIGGAGKPQFKKKLGKKISLT